MTTHRKNLLTIGGGITGTVMVWMLGSGLSEISRSIVFSVSFGVLLTILSLVLAWRVYSTTIEPKTRNIVLGGSALVLCSGISSVILNEQLIPNMSPAAKVPLYVVVAISFSFSCVYFLMDLILMGLFSCLHSENSTTEYEGISSYYQVFTATVGSCVIGAFYGLLYGLLDIEDGRHKVFSFVGLGVGFLAGAIITFLNISHTENEDASWAALNDPAPGFDDDDDDDDDATQL
eukprot:TRINITY_DN3351_c0_g1_i8.p1 TRINITY_DN3351_c0_g1~~TRINITY_DN3351_c0_g1_i8.p1  ORF type:complete len:265 (+),score=41.70 TRINITY_DN3351_c0_g1_i8:98-796(+)